MSATVRGGDKMRVQSRERGRVLLISDEAGAGAQRELIERAGFSVVGVERGAAALIALHQTRPHVVVADVRLRGIGAHELTRTLAGLEEPPPTVLVGAEPSDPERRARALADGAFDYVCLPEESELLVARLGQLVRLRLAIDALRAEADKDYLTGLANRRRFRKALGQEVERWRRYRVACALLLLDVDHMKVINDTHGHPAGDVVIRAVAAAISKQSRDNDTAARLGGEEFALLLAGADERSAEAAAERLRAAVESEQAGVVERVTISVGVAACPAHARSERDLFAAGDAALYRAKQAGRNRVEVAALATV